MVSERCCEMTSGQAASGPGLLMLTRSSLRMRRGASCEHVWRAAGLGARAAHGQADDLCFRRSAESLSSMHVPDAQPSRAFSARDHLSPLGLH